MSNVRFLLLSFLTLALSVATFGQLTFTQEDYSGGAATRDSFVAADFNRDGFDDVVYISYSQAASTTRLVIRLNDGNGGLLPEAVVPAQLPNSDDAPSSIATADFNGDGKLDLAVFFNSGTVVVLYGNGNGTFTQGPSYSGEPPVTESKMLSADFDNNGSPDLAILNNDGSLSLLLNNGDGTFNSRTAQLDSSAGVRYHSYLVAGDFNADGKMDLAWVDYAPCQQYNPCPSTVYIALNTGGGNFSSPQQVISYPDNEVRLSSGDADGDGLTDLMTSAPYTVDLFLANSDGSFSRQTFATNLYAEGTALVTDINGDGKLDIVAAGVSADSQDQVAFILGQGGRNFQTSGYQMYAAQSGVAEALEAGFFNSDSVKDLALMIFGGSGYGLHVLLNTTQPNDPCPAPGNAGVNFCAPQSGSTTGNSVQFIATARPDTQPMNRMELWVDGNKKFQVFNDRLDHAFDLENGSHEIDVVEVDAAGVYRKASASITVQNTPPFGYLQSALNWYNGTTTLPQYGNLQLFGWAADNEDGAPVNHVNVLLDGSVIGQATLGQSRPDVANAYGRSDFTNSGWTFIYNIGNLSIGTHNVTALAFDSQGASAQLTSYHGAGPFTVQADTPPFGYVDHVANASDGSTTVPQNGVLNISGWAADNEDGAPLPRVAVLIDGNLVGNATLGQPRPDVASVYKRSDFTNSGWSFSFNVGAMPAGDHYVSAVAYDSQGASTTLTNYQSIGHFTVH